MGVAASGLVSIRALRSAGIEVVVTDDRADAPGLQEARAAGADVLDGAPSQIGSEVLAEVDLVVVSPGVPEHAPMLREALAAGLPVWSEPELGWRLHPRRVIAITGTNGKTSTTELVTAMLRAGGVDAHACGNIGRAFTEAASASDAGATLVAELSSAQLRFCHALRPEVGVLLNLAPDHLDWHGGVEPYGAAKARMWRQQRAGQWAVVNADDPATLDLAAAHARGDVACFSGTATRVGRWPAGVHVRGGRYVSTLPGREGELFGIDELAVAAPHHLANTAAAAAAALLADVPGDAVALAARSFRPGRHRVETVAESGGVTWVDDSKATNPHAAAAALSSFDRVVWIAGGIAKGVDLSVLGRHLDNVRHAILIGESAVELAAVCSASDVPATRAGSMDEAVEVAARLAQPGDTVLLAPACSSFDMFRDYADRGDRFADAARRQVEGARGRS